MALDTTQFRAQFPEFDSADTALVTAKLADALARLDSEVFGSKLDAAHGLLTAHLLAMSPYGVQAKLVAKDRRTVYGEELRELKREVTSGFRVV